MAAIQVAIVTVVLFKQWLIAQKQVTKFLVSIAIVIALFLLMLLQSRTAVLAAATGVLYVCYPFLRSWYSKQKIIFIGLSALALALVVLSTVVKTGSSLGRSFIWENSMRLLKENWLWGVGSGKFNRTYNHIQASYFAENSITDGVALRANDGYYAFNEWLQVWIETGISGFLIFFGFTVFIFYLCLKNVSDKKQFYGPVLIPLLVASFFSYPLRNVPLILTGIWFCLTAVSHNFGVHHKIKYGVVIVFFVGAIMMVFNTAYAYYKRSQVIELIAEGFTTRAYEICARNVRAVRRDKNLSPTYLNVLYNTGRIKELIAEFDEVHRFNCNQSLHSVVAKAFDELKDSTNASRHLLTALYIAPYRLESRMDLLNFYKDRGDLVKAKYWAQQIEDCPMKIITEKGVVLKEKANEFITTGKITPGFQR